MDKAIEILKEMLAEAENNASKFPVYTDDYLFYEGQALALRGALRRVREARNNENNSK